MTNLLRPAPGGHGAVVDATEASFWRPRIVHQSRIPFPLLDGAVPMHRFARDDNKKRSEPKLPCTAQWMCTEALASRSCAAAGACGHAACSTVPSQHSNAKSQEPIVVEGEQLGCEDVLAEMESFPPGANVDRLDSVPARYFSRGN